MLFYIRGLLIHFCIFVVIKDAFPFVENTSKPVAVSTLALVVVLVVFFLLPFTIFFFLFASYLSLVLGFFYLPL